MNNLTYLRKNLKTLPLHELKFQRMKERRAVARGFGDSMSQEVIKLIREEIARRYVKK